VHFSTGLRAGNQSIAVPLDGEDSTREAQDGDKRSDSKLVGLSGEACGMIISQLAFWHVVCLTV
jgi:hypothetical protein